MIVLAEKFNYVANNVGHHGQDSENIDHTVIRDERCTGFEIGENFVELLSSS